MHFWLPRTYPQLCIRIKHVCTKENVFGNSISAHIPKGGGGGGGLVDAENENHFIFRTGFSEITA